MFNARALRTGSFALSSGGHSNVLIDMSRVLRTCSGQLLFREVLKKMFNDKLAFQAVGGPLAGADPVASAFCTVFAIPSWFGVRKEKKERGLDRDYITGSLNEGDRVLLVEDVTTTGGNLIRAAKAVHDVGGKVQSLFTVIDRGGLERAAEHLNIPNYFSMYDIGDLNIENLDFSVK